MGTLNPLRKWRFGEMSCFIPGYPAGFKANSMKPESIFCALLECHVGQTIGRTVTIALTWISK